MAQRQLMVIEERLQVGVVEARQVESSCLLCNSRHQNALFCNDSCQQTFASLQDLLWVESRVNDETTWQLMQMHWTDGMVLDPKFRQAWHILTHSFLDCDTLKDCLLSLRKCSGFYTCVLQKDNVITAVGLFRVHAAFGVRKVAEVSYVATNPNFRNEGMCKFLVDKLFSCLVGLGIRDIVLPSCYDAYAFWTIRHGFVEIDNLRTLFPEGPLNLQGFGQTIWLHKELN